MFRRARGLSLIAAAAVAGLMTSCGTLASAQGVRPAARPRSTVQGNSRQPAVPPIVRRAIQAARKLRFVGARIVEFRTSTEVSRHVEYVLKDGPRSRVWFPSDSPFTGQIIIEKGRQRLHYFPKTGEVQKSAARGDEAYNRLVQMIRDRQYAVSVGPGGPVAEIRTRMATIVDQSGIPAQRLWIDPKTGMVLKRELYDSSGARVGYFEFQRVNFEPVVNPGDFAINRANIRYTRLRDRVAEISGRTGLMPYALQQGQGYELTAVHELLPRSRRPILVETYKGTQGSVSLFQTKGPINARVLERVAGNRYRTYTWRQNGSSFALVGDLGVAELQRLAGLVGGG